ncbi:DUF3592 domain-containing protein [Streptomyces sp. NPDC092296]|uniref:DUF3592 domain-containing protein n=1 Tax=Streptomyces sp. NPDC092296 TaxID=3366012 RepID=UPI0037FF11C3
MPAALALLALAVLLATVRAARARRRHALRAAAVMRTGTRTSGVVTEVIDTQVEVTGRPRLQPVVKFTDHPGVDRWVTKTGTFDPHALPRTGDPAIVWFDPAAPGDERSLPVVLGTDVAVEGALARRISTVL